MHTLLPKPDGHNQRGSETHLVTCSLGNLARGFRVALLHFYFSCSRLSAGPGTGQVRAELTELSSASLVFDTGCHYVGQSDPELNNFPASTSRVLTRGRGCCAQLSVQLLFTLASKCLSVNQFRWAPSTGFCDAAQSDPMAGGGISTVATVWLSDPSSELRWATASLGAAVQGEGAEPWEEC